MPGEGDKSAEPCPFPCFSERSAGVNDLSHAFLAGVLQADIRRVAEEFKPAERREFPGYAVYMLQFGLLHCLGVLTQYQPVSAVLIEVIKYALNLRLRVRVNGSHYFTPLNPVMSLMTSPAMISPTTDGTNALLPGT